MSDVTNPSDLEAEIARLRAELLAARAEARSIAESLPQALDRRRVVRSLVADALSPSAWLLSIRRCLGRLMRRRSK
jgi:hypothetical protein